MVETFCVYTYLLLPLYRVVIDFDQLIQQAFEEYEGIPHARSRNARADQCLHWFYCSRDISGRHEATSTLIHESRKGAI